MMSKTVHLHPTTYSHADKPGDEQLPPTFPNQASLTKLAQHLIGIPLTLFTTSCLPDTPSDETFTQSTGAIDLQTNCSHNTPTRYALDFDNHLETTEKGICYSDTTGGTSNCQPSLTDATTPGRSGSGIRASSGYVALPLDDAFDFTVGSMSLWVQPYTYLGNSNEPFRLIDSDRTSDGWRFYLGKSSAPSLPQRLQFHATTVTNQGANLTTPIDSWMPGEWHHVAATWGATHVRLYVDGTHVSSQTRPQSFPTNDNTPPLLYLLGSNRSGNTWPARGDFTIDELRIWSSELSADDVAALASSPPSPALRYELNFDDPAEWSLRNACYSTTVGDTCSDPPVSIETTGYHDLGVAPTSGYVRIPTSALDLDGGSLSLWVGTQTYTGSSSEQFRILDSDAVSGGWRFYLGRQPVSALPNKLQFHATTSTNQGATLRAPIEDWVPGEWHHVAVTWDQADVRLYVDGSLAASQARTETFPTNDGPVPPFLYVLGSNRAGNTWNATGAFAVDSLATYAGTLSADAVAQIAAKPPTPRLAFELTFDTANSAEFAEQNACWHRTLHGCSHSPEDLASMYVSGRDGEAGRPPDGYIRAPAGDVLHLDGGSLSLWVGLDDYAGTSGHPFRWIDSDSNGNGWRVYLGRGLSPHAADRLQLHMTTSVNAGVSLFAPLGTWSPAEWHHVVATWDAEWCRLYVDGRLVDDAQLGNLTTFPRPGTAPPFLYLFGSARAGVVHADGRFRMDSVRSYERAFTPHQVSQLYAEQVGRHGPVIKSGRLEIALAGSQDGYGIARIGDLNDCSLRTTDAPSRQLWQVELEATHGAGKLRIGNGAVLGSEPVFLEQGTDRVIRWTGIQLPGTNFQKPPPHANANLLDVTIRLSPNPAQHEIRARIDDVTVHGDAWKLENITFPIVAGLAPLPGDEDTTTLVIPHNTIGRAFANPFAPNSPLPVAGKYPSRHWSMQWVGLAGTREHGSLYIAAHDAEGWLKQAEIQRNIPDKVSSHQDLRGLDVRFVTEADRSSRSFSPGWDNVIALTDGGWYELARRYRDTFALGQTWSPPPLATRSPSWLLQAALIRPGAVPATMNNIWLHFPEDGALLFDRRSWDYANRYPGNFSQGNDSPWLIPDPDLASGLENPNTPEKEFSTTLYFDPTNWDLQYDCRAEKTCCLPPWLESLDPELSLIRDAAGSLIPRQIDTCATCSCGCNCTENPPGDQTCDGRFSAPCRAHYYTCPGSSEWRTLIGNQAGSLFDAAPPVPAIDGYYLDVVSSYVPRPCFNTAHGHSIGGGTYWTEGYRQMLTEIRTKAEPHLSNLGLYSESFCDAYVGQLDGFLTWDAVSENPLPLAMAVYHDRSIFAGLHTSANDSLEGATAKQSLLFSWGGVLGYLIFDLLNPAPPYPQLRDHIFRLARLRRRWNEFLVLGDMLKPPRIREVAGYSGEPLLSPPVSGEPLPVSVVQVRNTHDGIVDMRTTAVVGSAWKSPTGGVGVVVVPTLPSPASPLSVFVPIDRVAWGLGPGPIEVNWETFAEESGWPAAQSFTDESGVLLQVAPEDPVLIRISP